jgi:hypothetical protein
MTRYRRLYSPPFWWVLLVVSILSSYRGGPNSCRIRISRGVAFALSSKSSSNNTNKLKRRINTKPVKTTQILQQTLLAKQQRTSKSIPQTQTQQKTAASERRQQSLQAGRHPLLSLNLNLDALAKERAPARAEELLQR